MQSDSNSMLSLFTNHLAKIIDSNSDKSIVDYINESDGLLYCGNCHTPKRMYIDFQGEQVLVPKACKCYEERMAEMKRKEEQEKRRLAAMRNKQVACIPQKLYNSSFNSYQYRDENLKAVEMCKRYVTKFAQIKQSNGSLLLWGGCGTGKSTIAACIANQLLEDGYSVAWCNFSTIIDDSDAVDAICNRALSVDVLILDDFGAERDTRYANERIFRLIETRDSVNKPVIYTTNLTIDALSKRLSGDNARIFDRVKQKLFPIEFKGSSYREEISRQNYAAMKELLSVD